MTPPHYDKTRPCAGFFLLLRPVRKENANADARTRYHDCKRGIPQPQPNGRGSSWTILRSFFPAPPLHFPAGYIFAHFVALCIRRPPCYSNGGVFKADVREASQEIAMAAPIEKQMHQHLIKLEAERCKQLESAGKKAKRRAIAKPWTRPGENALCQDTDLLILVSEYDYDLTDTHFQRYCEARGVLYVAGEPGSRRWEFFRHYTKSKTEYLKDPYFQFAQEHNGKRYRYTDDEMETGWRIVVIGRGKLQDCWELYTRHQR